MALSISNTSPKKFPGGFQAKPKTDPFAGGFQNIQPVKPLTLPRSKYVTGAYAETNPQYNSQSNPPLAQNIPTQQPTGGSNALLSQLNNLKGQYGGDATLAGIGGQKPVKGVVKNDPSLFKGIIDRLLGASAPNDTQTGLVKDIRGNASGNQAIGDEAKRISDEYAKEIARVGQLGAGAVAGNLSTGTNVVGSGNAAIASQSASTRMSALSEAQQAALQGTGQQLTAQSQEANALNNALGGANTQQAQLQAGLGSAGGFAQPSPAGYGQTVFDPATGSFGGGSGGLDPSNVANTLAQAVKSGQMTYEQAVASLGYAGGAGQQFLNNALGPGFNPTLSSATQAGQASVIGNLPQLEAADVAAEGVKNKVTNYLSEHPELNPSSLAAGNLLQQWIEGKQLTDPKYQTLFNLLNEYTNTLAPILGVGGSPTNLKTEIAQGFVNAAASGQSIAEVLENMQGLSRGKLQDIRSGATGGGVVSSPNVGSSGGGLFSWD